MNHSKLQILLVISLVLLGGCVFQSNPTTTVPDTQTGGSNGHDPDSGRIAITTQDIVRNNETFEFQARITFDFYIEERTFSNVTLCLYDAEGAVLNSTVIGDFSSPIEHETIRISANTTPKYTVADHIDFHDYENMGIRFLVHKPDGLSSGFSYDAIGFDYPRPERRSHCL